MAQIRAALPGAAFEAGARADGHDRRSAPVVRRRPTCRSTPTSSSDSARPCRRRPTRCSATTPTTRPSSPGPAAWRHSTRSARRREERLAAARQRTLVAQWLDRLRRGTHVEIETAALRGAEVAQGFSPAPHRHQPRASPPGEQEPENLRGVEPGVADDGRDDAAPLQVDQPPERAEQGRRHGDVAPLDEMAEAERDAREDEPDLPAAEYRSKRCRMNARCTSSRTPPPTMATTENSAASAGVRMSPSNGFVVTLCSQGTKRARRQHHRRGHEEHGRDLEQPQGRLARPSAGPPSMTCVNRSPWARRNQATSPTTAAASSSDTANT